MEYTVIFTAGYTDDLDSLTREIRSDVLLCDEKGNYYELNFLTIDRIKGEFDNEKTCYFENNLIILHKVTKENIINSIPELHRMQYFIYWHPLTLEQIEKYYAPKEDWTIFTVIAK